MTIGEYYGLYEEAKANLIVKEEALAEATRQRDEALAAFEGKDAEFQGAIKRRENPDRVILVYSKAESPLLVVPEEGDAGFRFLEVDTDDLEIPNA